MTVDYSIILIQNDIHMHTLHTRGWSQWLVEWQKIKSSPIVFQASFIQVQVFLCISHTLVPFDRCCSHVQPTESSFLSLSNDRSALMPVPVFATHSLCKTTVSSGCERMTRNLGSRTYAFPIDKDAYIS